MGKVAMVLAGQGAQIPGMGRDLYESSPAARAVFDAADKVHPGLKDLCFEGPSQELNLTLNTQPCVMTMDIACARALQDRVGEPEFQSLIRGAAGFSLGEVAAVCCLGMLDELAGLEFVIRRADAMHRAGETNPGALYAVIKLTAGQIEALSKDLGVHPVNYNSPSQTVVACRVEDGERLTAAVAAAGGKALKLPVSGAFHSPLMDPAAEELALVLEDMHFNEAQIPLYANLTSQPYGDPRNLLAQQVNHPVLWTATIETMIDDGFDTFIELGPGQTLSRFINQINPNVSTLGVRDMESLQDTANYLKEIPHA